MNATIASWVEEGRIILPGKSRAGTVDLMRALGHLCGVDGLELSSHAVEMVDEIGEHDHYVFILVDGMGSALLQSAEGCRFLKGHTTRTIDSVFPSTTSAALTTLATCRWPGSHGVLGWWLYLEEYGLSSTPLPFVERFSEKPLGELGVDPDVVFPIASNLPQYRRDSATVMGAPHVDSVYSKFASGGTKRIGYESIPGAVDAVLARLAVVDRPSFTYVYLPQLDASCHANGVGHESSAKALALMDAELERMCERLAGKARLVVTADHGLVDVPMDRRGRVDHDDAIMTHLVCPPSGEARVPIFHVKSGREGDFAGEFGARFGEMFVLVTADQADEMHLFGPEPLCRAARRRLGTSVGVSSGPVGLEYRRPDSASHVVIGHHGGLLNEEVRVPVILA